jgi:hypothetical protein
VVHGEEDARSLSGEVDFSPFMSHGERKGYPDEFM